jgi:hypothetical protein
MSMLRFELVTFLLLHQFAWYKQYCFSRCSVYDITGQRLWLGGNYLQHKEQKRQCACYITLWHAHVTTETQECIPLALCTCHGQQCFFFNANFVICNSQTYFSLHVKNLIFLSDLNLITIVSTDFSRVSNIKFH